MGEQGVYPTGKRRIFGKVELRGTPLRRTRLRGQVSIEVPLDAGPVKPHKTPFYRPGIRFVEMVYPGGFESIGEEKPNKKTVPDIQKKTFVLFRLPNTGAVYFDLL